MCTEKNWIENVPGSGERAFQEFEGEGEAHQGGVYIKEKTFLLSFNL